MLRNKVKPKETRYINPDNDPKGPYILTDATSPFERPSFQYKWHGKLPPSGRSWRYSAEKVHTLEVEGRVSFSATGQPRLKRYLSETESKGETTPEVHPLSQIELIIRTAMKTLAGAIAKNPASLANVEWRDLERVLREVFESLGFITELTRSGKDGGFDLRLQVKNSQEIKTFFVEVKHWVSKGQKPGIGIVKALFDIVVRETTGATGLILSSSGFTKDALNGRTEIEKQKIRLGNQIKIISLCQNYLQNADGLWTPTTDLADMLLSDTL